MLYKIGSLIIIFILIFVFFNIFFNVETCRAKKGDTLYIGGTGIGNYTTIQDAIDNSSDDNTVYVYNGMYLENIIINKSINLVGLDKNSTIIKGNGSLYIILVKSSWVNITGFTIQNGKVGVYVPEANYSFNNISDNIISDNWDGIRLYYSSNNKISGNSISDHSGSGTVLYESSNNLITENIFMDNYKALFLGRWSDNNVVSRNNFTENDYTINLDFSFYNLIHENLITNGKLGVSLSFSNNNNVTNNDIENNDRYGIYLINSNDNVISPNNFLNNYQDVKEGPSPPAVKAPGFEILFTICVILLVLFLRRKYLKF